MKKHFQIIFIFILVIISINFFEARFLPENFTRYLQFFTVLAAVIISLPHSFPKWEGFVLPLQILILSIIISIFSAYFLWAQSFADSVKATVPLMLWIFVFYLLRIKIPIRTIENIILVYGALYVLLYFFQFINSHTVYFSWSERFQVTRGIIRIVFPGGGIFFLAVFLALNRLTIEGSKKFLWLPYVAAGLLLPVMQVSRQLIAAAIFIYILHFIRELNFVKKSIILLSFSIVILFITNINHPIVEGLKGAQEETASQGKEYIRVKAGTYFITEFQPNILSRIIGNGVHYGNKSEYGKTFEKLANEKYYYLNDVGLVALYTMFGIPAIFAFILIWVNSFRFHVPKEYLYLKYYLWFLLITSLTSYNIYDPNYLIATVFTIYIFQRIYIREKYHDSLLESLKKLLSGTEVAEYQQMQ